MAVYITGCLLSVLFTGTALRIKHKSEGWRYWLAVSLFSSFPLMLIATIRYNVGQDYSSYVRLFRQALSGYRQPGLEIPYYELNRLVGFLGGDETWIFAICAIVFSLFTFRHIFHDSPSPRLSVFLLVTTTYYFIFMNGMRQMVGCAILMYSIRYVEERKFRHFLLLVLLASCFHYSCIIFAFTYWLYNININRSAIFVSTIAIFAFSSVFAGLINRIVSITQYAHYIGGYFDTSERGYIGLTINIIIIIFATLYYDAVDMRYRFYYNLTVISLWLSAFVGKVVLISRVRWMFGLPVIIMIPLALNKVENRSTRRIVTAAIVIFYALYFYYTIGINNSATVLPYQTIFSR